ncbi:phage portal protein [Patescibacteria group bacterium]|nr:phage portal protein [Patescibacteria group bacterium]
MAETSEVLFPKTSDKPRLSGYDYYEKLFMGDHFTAFNIAIDNNKDFNKAYAKIRYVKANFAGLISKVIADMLFSEPIKLKVESEEQQNWLDSFVQENKLNQILYESALSNSYLGDILFKLRIGKRMAGDEDSSIILSNLPPSIYFPKINLSNIDEDPEVKELCWIIDFIDKDNKPKKYLRKEIHLPKKIVNELWRMEGDKVVEKVPFSEIGDTTTKPFEDTKINRQLVVHIPNWKTVSRFWGISDFYDLDTLFFAINNRISKIDNILDKHSDPLLVVPTGILDEKGKVKKGSLGVVEVQDANDGKPEYVVWDASLENAFNEIDKMVELLMMTSEISPDILGMGKGQSDSGRALKYKMLRTIAKTARKRLYYDNAIKEIIYRSMMLAKAWGLKAGGVAFSGEPVIPEIVWADGIPADETELIENENARIDGGTETIEDAIMKIDGVDRDTAVEKAKKIKDEKAIEMPTNGFDMKNNPFNQVKDLKKKAEKQGGK